MALPQPRQSSHAPEAHNAPWTELHPSGNLLLWECHQGPFQALGGRRPAQPRGEGSLYFLLYSKKKDHTQVSHTTGVALAERTPTQDSDRQPLPPSPTQSSSHKPKVLQSTWEQPGSTTTKVILVSTSWLFSIKFQLH